MCRLCSTLKPEKKISVYRDSYRNPPQKYKDISRVKNLIMCKDVDEIPDNMRNLRIIKFKFWYEFSRTLKKLPSILDNLEYLDCSYSSVEQLPFSRSIIELDCSKTLVRDINMNFSHLRIFDCSHAKITSLPDSFPVLEKLDCSFTKLKKLPTHMPKLTKLSCFCTDIEEIPLYPELDVLSCRNSNVASIAYPEKLTFVNASDTKVRIIPRLPKTVTKAIYFSCRFLLEVEPQHMNNNLELEVYGCVWLNCEGNADYERNLNLVISLQRRIRGKMIEKYMKTQKFAEWFYKPENAGGKKLKSGILNFFQRSLHPSDLDSENPSDLVE